MTSVSICLPFRDDGHRTPSKEWIVARWCHHWPNAELIEAADDGIDPFNKSRAVNTAARQATGEVLVILDADTWCDPATVQRAIDIAASGKLVLPGKVAHRLHKAPSRRILAGDPSEPFPRIGKGDIEHTVVPVGFLHVIAAEAFWRVNGYDERFRGWGGEDSVFIGAVETLVAPRVRLDATIYSLWHPRPRVNGRRVWTGQTKRNLDLLRRYSHARGNPTMMRALVDEWG